uniref:Uncharacterized protein n=1 Tax=Sphaerodactylus townsendi TaxID=933632 RepID=A0ACB8F1C8_9SAUR
MQTPSAKSPATGGSGNFALLARKPTTWRSSRELVEVEVCHDGEQPRRSAFESGQLRAAKPGDTDGAAAEACADCTTARAGSGAEALGCNMQFRLVHQTLAPYLAFTAEEGAAGTLHCDLPTLQVFSSDDTLRQAVKTKDGSFSLTLVSKKSHFGKK